MANGPTKDANYMSEAERAELSELIGATARALFSLASTLEQSDPGDWSAAAPLAEVTGSLSPDDGRWLAVIAEVSDYQRTPAGRAERERIAARKRQILTDRGEEPDGE